MSFKYFNVIFLFALMQGNAFAIEPAARWYSAQQQSDGHAIFQKNCAVCHGEKAQATAHWKQKNANGQYPAPPLNGSAHAWHHSLDNLRKSVNDGGQKIGGLMPSFEHTLSSKERDSAIAFFQSQWSDALYNKWSKNFKVPPLNTSTKLAQNPVLNLLMQRLNSPDIDAVTSVADEQLYQVMVKGQSIYLTKDGRFAVIGHLIDLKTGKKLSQ